MSKPLCVCHHFSCPLFIQKRAHCYLMKHIFVSHALASSQQSSYSISLHIVISPLLLHRYHLFIPYADRLLSDCIFPWWPRAYANTQDLNFSKLTDHECEWLHYSVNTSTKSARFKSTVNIRFHLNRKNVCVRAMRTTPKIACVAYCVSIENKIKSGPNERNGSKKIPLSWLNWQ